MKFNIWGAEEAWLVDYLNSRTLAKIEPSEQDLKAFNAFQEGEGQNPRILKIEGDTAIITISGGLSQNGPDRIDRIFGFGGTGYKEIIASVAQIENNAQIKNVVLLMNTPGGNMVGLDNAWKSLFTLRKDKNIVAINDGFLFSAGYYLASAAHEIHSTSATNEIGSIGVMVAGLDFSKMMEKDGVKKVVIVSKNAPDKNLNIGDEKAQKILQERVDTFEQFFLKRISEGRGLKTDFIAKNFGRGGLLISKNPQEGEPDALSVKMIDKVLNISQSTGATSAPVKINAKQEEQMTLAEYLAANPAIKAEFDQLIKAGHDKGLTAGHKAGQEEVEGRIKKAFAFMGKDSVYPVRIQSLAIAVIKGEKSMEALEAVVEVHDMNEEEKKSVEAKKETNKTGESPPASPDGKKIDGKVRDEESLKAGIKNVKTFI